MRINKDSDGSRIIHIIPLSSFELLNIDWQNVISSGMLNMLGLAFYFKASSQATFLTICLDSGGNMPSMNNPGKTENTHSTRVGDNECGNNRNSADTSVELINFYCPLLRLCIFVNVNS